MNIQAEFPFVSKADWLAQIQKDLKGGQPEGLNWALNERITISPLLAASDFPELPAPLSTGAGWEICENVDAADPVLANAQALEALRAGAEGLNFYLHTAPDQPFMSLLLKDVYIDFIGLHFSGPGMIANPGAILALLSGLATERGIPVAQLKGSLAYDPIAQTERPDWRYLKELIELSNEQFPGFRLLSLSATADAPDTELSGLLTLANQYITRLVQEGLSPAVAAGAMTIQVAVGPLYFVEIAKLRALKVLWLNLLKGWDVQGGYPFISATFDPAAYADALYTNMIRATTMAMSAVLGGANQLTVRPYDEGRESLAQHAQSFGRRIARNVQHLLKMESGLDQVVDPAAGSYYIDNLTNQIAGNAWDLFRGKNN